MISLTSAGKNPLSKLADISLNTNSKETKYRVVSIASRVAALTIADSIYTYIAMRTDGAKSLQIEKSMESLKSGGVISLQLFLPVLENLITMCYIYHEDVMRIQL